MLGEDRQLESKNLCLRDMRRLKKASVKVVRRDDADAAALDEMAYDDKGMLDDRGGALDYEQYYPTLLPLQVQDHARRSQPPNPNLTLHAPDPAQTLTLTPLQLQF